MLLDDRRIVLSLEAICWCTAAMVFFQQTEFPSAIAILPLLMAVLIHVEYAPPAPHSASRSACRSACHSTASCEPLSASFTSLRLIRLRLLIHELGTGPQPRTPHGARTLDSQARLTGRHVSKAGL